MVRLVRAKGVHFRAWYVGKEMLSRNKVFARKNFFLDKNLGAPVVFALDSGDFGGGFFLRDSF
jgi:hypothetical protein